MIMESQVTLIVDRDVYAQEYMGCHPCANASSIKVKTQGDFEKFCLLPVIYHCLWIYSAIASAMA